MASQSPKKTAVIIGTGFGGLSAGFHALAKGYKTIFLEAGDQPGGRARVFKKKGYSFDAGPTVITAPYLFDELFELLGEKSQDHIDLVAVDPFYRILYADGSTFDYVGDEKRLLENVEKISPQDVEGYKKLAKHSERIFDIGYTDLADKPFDTVGSMLKVLPDMIRLENYRSVYSLVSKYIQSEKLRQAFSFEPLLVGGNPFKVTSIYMLIHWLERKWGVHFAMGGTTAVVSAMVKVLKKHGAEFRFGASVDRLEIEDGDIKEVHCTNGSSFPCEKVISNADPIKTYGDWIPEKHRPHHSNKKLAKRKQSVGLFVTYFGVRKKYPDLKHHTIVLGERFKGLLTDIFDKKTLAEDFSLYLHAPTVTDPSLAPEGCECFYVLSPVPNNLSGIDWEKQKENYQNRILDALEERLLPGLKENLDVVFSVTPDYFENELQSTSGSAFGIEPVLTQSAYFRFHNQSEDVKGLYFVGANTHPGAGLPGVINSAKMLDRILPPALEH